MPKRPVALDDLHRFQLPGDPQISPDGRRVVFTVKRTDTEKNKYFTRLWLADVETGESRAFTGDGQNDTTPRWSPDGTQIAFISDRQKPKSQIYLIPADGGEARPLTRLEEGSVQQPVWSSDGKQIAFLYRATPAGLTEKAKKEREESGASSPVRVHTRLYYRLDAFGYFDDSYWQVWVADVETGEAKALTNAPHNHSGLAWSPDGSRLAYIVDDRDDEDLGSHHEAIWTVAPDRGEPERVEAPPGPKAALAWSPDGKWLAYAGHTDPEDTWGNLNIRVMLLPAAGGEARDLTGASDKTVGYLTLSDMHEAGGGALLQWAPDSESLFFAVSEQGDTKLYRVGRDGSELAALTPAGHEMGGFSLGRDGGRIGVLLGNAVELQDIHAGSAADEGLELRRLTRLNKDVLAEVEMQRPEEARVPNGDGGEVHTWVLRPTLFEEGRRYPCVLYIHGGPALQHGGHSAPFHEYQWLAANGYVVVFPNPRGSKGYGEAHTSAIKGDWGNKDWQDVQAVADYAAGLPYVDPERMAIMGGSYGGYMTAWAVGHTDRFACAITDRLVGNLQSMAGTCDFPWKPGNPFGGSAWEDPSHLWRVSPLAYAARISTPLLIIHSDGDLRCPVEQAEQLFAALRHQKKTVEFVRYPAESSHGLSRNGPPDLRLDRLRRNLAWLDRYLKG